MNIDNLESISVVFVTGLPFWCRGTYGISWYRIYDHPLDCLSIIRWLPVVGKMINGYLRIDSSRSISPTRRESTAWFGDWEGWTPAIIQNTREGLAAPSIGTRMREKLKLKARHKIVNWIVGHGYNWHTCSCTCPSCATRDTRLLSYSDASNVLPVSI